MACGLYHVASWDVSCLPEDTDLSLAIKIEALYNT